MKAKSYVILATLLLALSACTTATPERIIVVVTATPPPPQRASTLALPTSSYTSSCISPVDAPRYVGQRKCVAGIVTTSKRPNANSRPLFINFKETLVFYAVAFDDMEMNFPPITSGICYQITGVIKPYAGKFEIILDRTTELSQCR